MVCSGDDIVDLCSSKLGQEYVYGAVAPKNNPNWDGPWDCAELCSWGVYIGCKTLYGCTDNSEDASKADAYTGAWKRDVLVSGIQIPIAEAILTPGAMLLLRNKSTGHIAISAGDGATTIEAKGTIYGVVNDSVNRLAWNYGILVPGVEYNYASHTLAGDNKYFPPKTLRNIEDFHKDQYSIIIDQLHTKLLRMGLLDSPPSGAFDIYLESALRDFQLLEGVTPHGELDNETAALLDIDMQ